MCCFFFSFFIEIIDIFQFSLIPSIFVRAYAFRWKRMLDCVTFYALAAHRFIRLVKINAHKSIIFILPINSERTIWSALLLHYLNLQSTFQRILITHGLHNLSHLTHFFSSHISLFMETCCFDCWGFFYKFWLIRLIESDYVLGKKIVKHLS